MTKEQNKQLIDLARKFEEARLKFEDMAQSAVPPEKGAKIERAVKLHILEAEAIEADEALIKFKKALRPS